MKSLTEQLKEYLANTPKEQIEKDWQEIYEKTKDIDSPKVSEYLKCVRAKKTEVPMLWQIALKGAKYLVEECEYDYDSSAMDGFLTAIGCDVHDEFFMDWYFTNITKVLGYEE